VPDANYDPQSAEPATTDPRYLDVSLSVLPTITAQTPAGQQAHEAGVDLSAISSKLHEVLVESQSFKRVSMNESADYVLVPVVVGVSDFFNTVVHLTISIRDSSTRQVLYSRTITGGGFFGRFTQEGSIDVILNQFRTTDLPFVRRAIAAATPQLSGPRNDAAASSPGGTPSAPSGSMQERAAIPVAPESASEPALPDEDANIEPVSNQYGNDDVTSHAIGGAIVGIGGGLAAGLASCTPTLIYPIAYPFCVAMWTVAGTAVGTVAGLAVAPATSESEAAATLPSAAERVSDAEAQRARAPADNLDGLWTGERLYATSGIQQDLCQSRLLRAEVNDGNIEMQFETGGAGGPTVVNGNAKWQGGVMAKGSNSFAYHTCGKGCESHYGSRSYSFTGVANDNRMEGTWSSSVCGGAWYLKRQL
jgi:hypothetical protein